MQKSYNKTENIFFFGWLAAVLCFFCWSRFDASNHIYYFGDGSLIVNMINILLQGYDWDNGVARLIETLNYQEELLPFTHPPEPGHHYYNFSGYVIVGTWACQFIYSLGFNSLSVQQILHGLNVVFQLLTLWFLFSLGKRISDRYTGLLAITFFSAFPLAVMEAHYERPESWLCLLTTLMVYCAFRFREAPNLFALLLGNMIGLAITAKYSHIFLGLIPALLMVSDFNEQRRLDYRKAWVTFIQHGGLVVIGLLFSMLVNAPFIFFHLADYFTEVGSIANVYRYANYPYAQEHYSYVGQLGVIIHYFTATLGLLWTALITAGLLVLLLPRWRPAAIGITSAWVIVTPLLFLVFYFSWQIIFIERNFSAIEGLIALIAAAGFSTCCQMFSVPNNSPVWQRTLQAGFLVLVLVVPAKLDYIFITHYIQTPDKPERLVLQNRFKQDFPKFWIKNVFFTHNYSGELPDKPSGMPRIYKVEDLNEHWSAAYIKKLQANDFILIGTYCSEFSNLPPNNLTIYHSAAKYHYFIRRDEWPESVPAGYFQTNCQ